MGNYKFYNRAPPPFLTDFSRANGASFLITHVMQRHPLLSNDRTPYCGIYNLLTNTIYTIFCYCHHTQFQYHSFHFLQTLLRYVSRKTSPYTRKVLSLKIKWCLPIFCSRFVFGCFFFVFHRMAPVRIQKPTKTTRIKILI